MEAKIILSLIFLAIMIFSESIPTIALAIIDNKKKVLTLLIASIIITFTIWFNNRPKETEPVNSDYLPDIQQEEVIYNLNC